MKKPSIPWLSAIIMVAVSTMAGPPDGQEAGLQGGALVRDRYGTPEGLQQALVSPFVAGDHLSTLDGSQRFGVSLLTDTAPNLLSLVVQPGTGGDLVRLIIHINRQTADNVATESIITTPVSGVCTNGIISCRPGSWDACNPYQFTFDAQEHVQLTTVPLTQLSGCFCINNSCGQDLYWQNRRAVLFALGGSLVAALQHDGVKLAISSVAVEDSAIRYAGRLVAPRQTFLSSADQVVVPPTVPGKDWLTAPPLLDEARDNLLAPEARSLQGSLVSVLDQRARGDRFDMNAWYSCQTVRHAALVPDVREQRLPLQANLCSDHFIYSRISEGTTSLDLDIISSGPAGLSEANKSCPAGSLADGWHRVASIPQYTEVLDEYQALTGIRASISISGAGCSTASQTIDSTIQRHDVPLLHPVVCGAVGPQGVTLTGELTLQRTITRYQEQLHDSCAPYRQRQDCIVMEASSDGVVTVNGGRTTGLTPLPSCRTLTLATQRMLICRPFWETKERYLCQGEQLSRPSTAALDRVKITSTADSSSLYYRDLAGQAMQTDLPKQPELPPCQASCRVRTMATRSQVTSDGPVSRQVLQGEQASVSGLRLCVTGQCPLTTGESVERPCGCDGELGPAAASLSVLEAAGNDLICTNPTAGTP